jgi:hypothetical protein
LVRNTPSLKAGLVSESEAFYSLIEAFFLEELYALELPLGNTAHATLDIPILENLDDVSGQVSVFNHV